MNKDTLIPGAHKLTREENSLGGTNSAINRRAKKRALEIARDILSMPVDDGTPTDVSDISSLEDVSQVTLDVMTAILANLANKAIKGDLRASRDLLTISGDYTTRQETQIGIKDQFDDDHTEYIIRVKYLGDEPTHEVRYFDNDHNPVKTIYGEEAKRIIDERIQNGKNDIQFKIHRVRSTSGEERVLLEDDD